MTPAAPRRIRRPRGRVHKARWWAVVEPMEGGGWRLYMTFSTRNEATWRAPVRNPHARVVPAVVEWKEPPEPRRRRRRSP